MVVDDLHVRGIGADPAKADAPLVVHANTVLALAIVPQLLEAIARWHAKFVEATGGVENAEFPQHHAPKIGGKASDGLTRPEALGVAVGKASDHVE